MQRIWQMASLASLLACAGSSVEEPVDDPVPEPTPYIVEEDSTGEIEVDLQALSQDLEATLETIWSINAGPVLDAYAQVQADQTEACPRTYVNDGNVYWFDQCTTDGGTSFSGYGFYYDYADYPLGEMWFGELRTLNGAARVDTAGGNALDIAGSAQLIVADHNTQPARLYRSELRGTFTWDGPSAAGTWLEQDLAPDLALQVYERTDLGGAMMSIDGGLSGTDGASAYVFDQVTVIEGSLGGPCPEEAFGVISVRTQDGAWVDVIFDGPDPETFEADPAECDGKGKAYYRGEELGSVSVDFTKLGYLGEGPW